MTKEHLSLDCQAQHTLLLASGEWGGVTVNGQAFPHVESRLWWIAAELRRPSDELCEKSLYTSNNSVDKAGPLCDILRDIAGLTVLKTSSSVLSY